MADTDNNRVTANEYLVLRAIAHNYYHDGTSGRDLISNPVWANLINDSNMPSGIEGKRLSGVVSSLQKKGFVKTDGECIWLTEAGYNTFESFSKPT